VGNVPKHKIHPSDFLLGSERAEELTFSLSGISSTLRKRLVRTSMLGVVRGRGLATPSCSITAFFSSVEVGHYGHSGSALTGDSPFLATGSLALPKNKVETSPRRTMMTPITNTNTDVIGRSAITAAHAAAPAECRPSVPACGLASCRKRSAGISVNSPRMPEPSVILPVMKTPMMATPTLAPMERVNCYVDVATPRSSCPTALWAAIVSTGIKAPMPMPTMIIYRISSHPDVSTVICDMKK
jgi:hypothetical protein